VKYNPINFKDKLSKFTDLWSPKVIAEMNDYQFKVVKFQGEFVWHDHQDTDETFIVLDGSMVIDFEDGGVELSEGEMFVVPRRKRHRPAAETECKVLLIEPRGVVNTGGVGGDFTAANDVWI
jgi:mannose-6-phosphate isomerase-like protein (cupin superfamily)